MEKSLESIEPTQNSHLVSIDESSFVDNEINTLWLSAFEISADMKRQIQNSVGEYSHLDHNINKLPQFKYDQELLECLSQFTLQENTYEIASNLNDQLKKGRDDVKYEIVIENQRGATVFGSKIYTQQQLFYPVDPPKFQTLTGMKLQSLELYPEPNHNWKWVWNKWHVLMINDVDENGWIYSKVSFNSKNWTSAGQFGKFARRRIWIRMMKKTHDDFTTEQDDEVENTLSVLEPAKEFDKPKGWLFQRNDKNLNFISESQLYNKEGSQKLSENGKGNIFCATNLLPNKTNEARSCEDYKMVKDIEKSSLKTSKEVRIVDYRKVAPANNQHIRHLYSEVSLCPEDIDKTEKILHFFSHLNNGILLFLIEDFELCENKSNSWVYKILRNIYLPASREIFLNRFQHDIIDKVDSSSECGPSLRKLYGICDDAIKNEKV